MIKQYAKLLDMQRINGSNLGNPNYSVTLEMGDGSIETMRSSSNSSWCYSINSDWIDKTITYTTTRAGRIDYMQVTTLHDIFSDPIFHNTSGNINGEAF